jgi:uncharacterized membrane protein
MKEKIINNKNQENMKEVEEMAKKNTTILFFSILSIIISLFFFYLSYSIGTYVPFSTLEVNISFLAWAILIAGITGLIAYFLPN